jgi:hypothetical protein
MSEWGRRGPVAKRYPYITILLEPNLTFVLTRVANSYLTADQFSGHAGPRHRNSADFELNSVVSAVGTYVHRTPLDVQ